jgi:hypothetical protein
MLVIGAPPAIADASSCVTSLQASTLYVAALLGDGEGLFSDEVEDEFDDPHAPTRRPAATTAPSTTLDRRARITR